MRKLSPEEEKRTMGSIQVQIRAIEEKVKAVKLVVVLLGAGGKGLEERRSVAKELRRKGILSVIPEDILPPRVAHSLLEREMLSAEEVDLAFVNVQSWGSTAEFVEFHNDARIAPKLRVMVAREHHPLYGSSSGYLADTYLTHDAVYGHVYMQGEKAQGIPSSEEIVVKISERYRQWKAFNSR